MDPFATLGLARRYDVDPRELETKYRDLQRALHPDRHVSGSPSERRMSLSRAVEVNEAYRLLRDDLARVGIPNLAAFFTHQAISESVFPSLFPPGPLNTVSRLRLEYAAPRAFFRDQTANLISGFDPLFTAAEGQTDLLLDRYIAHRDRNLDPVTQQELLRAAQYAARSRPYGPHIAMGLQGRVQRAVWSPQVSARPSRGIAAVRAPLRQSVRGPQERAGFVDPVRPMAVRRPFQAAPVS